MKRDRPVERFLIMDEMIRNREYPSSQEFMQRFDISVRAVHGDIQYLKQKFRAPIAFSRHHGGYYYVEKDWRLFQNTSASSTNVSQVEDITLPDIWLWNEIERRFGHSEAASLYLDFCKQREPERELGEDVGLCILCGKPLSRFAPYNAICHAECKAMIYPTNVRKEPAICRWCKKPLSDGVHFNVVYHDECRIEHSRWLQNEDNKKYYRRKHPDARTYKPRRIKGEQ